ncbi:MmyB family transcriptional regulator [Bradyrhizobium sp. USDA 4354]
MGRYILDRTWSARRRNAQASRLFAGWLDGDGEKNLPRYIFIRPEARTLIPDWMSRAHRVVAKLRAAATGCSDDSDIRPLRKRRSRSRLVAFHTARATRDIIQSPRRRQRGVSASYRG